MSQDLTKNGEVSILVTNVKPELRALVQAAARENDRSVAAEVRHMLARVYGSKQIAAQEMQHV